jgi:hypothetical protein
MKNTLLALLGFILLSTPLAATAQGQFDDFSYTWTVDPDSGYVIAFTITGYTGPGGAVTIPDIIPGWAGQPVTAIGDFAFQNKTTVTSVTTPRSVDTIGRYAFQYCTSLTSVTMPGVMIIGDGAFQSCRSLTSAAIGGSLWFGNPVSIGDEAFQFCSSLTGVTFFYGVSSIGDSAFAQCYSLASVPISYGVTSIGSAAFSYCTNVHNIVTIPGSVTSIGDAAFYYCISLTNVTISDSVTNIGSSAFAYCTSVMAITVDAANSAYSSSDGVLFNKSQTTLLQCPGGKAGSYLVPSSVTSIGRLAFVSCGRLTNITIPGSITNIGNYAFQNCTSLTYFTIPGSVTTIEPWAFDYCTSLQGVFFKGNALANIGSDVFFGDNTATVYYLPGTTGWGATFAGRPAVLWNPLMQTGVGPAGFGFSINGTTNIPIVIEASTSLASSTWVPLQSLNLTNGAFYFSDPNWSNYPARFYRIRSP